MVQGSAYGSEGWRIPPALPSHYRQMVLGVMLELALKSGVGYNQACKGAAVNLFQYLWTADWLRKELNTDHVLMHVILQGLIGQRHSDVAQASCTARLWGFKGKSNSKHSWGLRVEHHGWMYGTENRKCICICAVFLPRAPWEGFQRAISEALAWILAASVILSSFSFLSTSGYFN